MNPYVDGYVMPLPKDRVEDYRRIALKAGALWREHGALAYHECIAEDLSTEGMTGFDQCLNLGPDETVVFAWVVFASRAERDRVNARVMSDPRLTGMCPAQVVPDVCRRMVYGGFQTLVSL